MNERIEKRDQIVPEDARKHLQTIRELFRREGLDVLLFGSRPRNSHTAASDFDVSIVKVMPDSTSDADLAGLYMPYYNHIARTLRDTFHDVHAPARALIIPLDGLKFSVTPKFRRENNTRDLMHLDMGGKWRINNPVNVLFSSKFKNQETHGKFLETTRYVMKKLHEHSLEVSNFVVASLICRVDNKIFLSYGNLEKRTEAVLKWLSDALETKESLEWNSMDNGERIFEIRPGDLPLAKQWVSILLEDYKKK